MTRLSAAFACLMPLCAAATGRERVAEDGQAVLEELRRTHDELDSAMKRLEPSLNELSSFRESYRDSPAFEAMLRRRLELRREILPELERCQRLAEEMLPLRGRYGMAQLQHSLQALSSTGKLDYAVGSMGIPIRSRVDDIQHRYFAFKDKAAVIIHEDQEAYVAGVKFRADKRRQALAAGIGGAVAVLAFLALAAWRMTRPAEPDIPPAAPAALPVFGPGSVLEGHFRVERELGRGGWGVVYEARDLALGRKVALKKMHEALAGAEEAELAQLLTEARSVAALKHPNIVEIYSMSREGRGLYLVYELIQGESLAARLHRTGPLALPEAKSVVRQAAAALDHAHAARIIHRDLKPANIMLAEGGLAKVMDFGIAHQASATVARLTRAQACGTPAYMAPEQELGSVCRESDIFSLGACLYEILSGRIPFTGPDYLAQKEAMGFEPLAPAQADALVRRALHPDPRQRFHSGAELAAEFAKV